MNLSELIYKCKCGVYLTANKHKDVYQSAAEAIKEINDFDFSANGKHEDYEPEIDDELAQRMIKEDSIYELQFYPDTPIGSYTVYGTSLDEVLLKAESCF